MFNRKKIAWSLLIVLIAGLLPGCGHQHKTFSHLDEKSSDIYKCEKNITVCVKALEKKEVVKVFGKHLFNDIQPIHILLKNDSKKSISIKENFLTLPIIDQKEINNRIQRAHGWKMFSFLAMLPAMVPGMFLFPLFPFLSGPVLALGFDMYTTLLISITIGAASSSLAVTYVIYKGHISRSDRMKKQCGLPSFVTIPSGEQADVLVFVNKSDWPQDFSMTLHYEDGSQCILDFPVTSNEFCITT